jgi:erythronate-4-phosphate dehydrogenase
MTPEMVRDADLLLVRSVTKVNASLLAGSRVRFVGSATIGTDHIDETWLQNKGIGFAAAPGCNAGSVAQYLAAALVWAAARMGWRLSNCSLGVVGVGNCGSQVAKVAGALGTEVCLNDPPLARVSGDPRFRPLKELLECDFLTLHVPLTYEGEDATWRLINERCLQQMKPGGILINASRGHIVDEGVLMMQLDQRHLGGAILDAWENEPHINCTLMRRVMLGTPHIAGYSYDGKVTGTRMIYAAACHVLGVTSMQIDVPMPPATVPNINLEVADRSLDSVLSELVLTSYPIWRDSADLMVKASENLKATGLAFDQLRTLYPLRREFQATRVELNGAPDEYKARAGTLGFKVLN